MLRVGLGQAVQQVHVKPRLQEVLSVLQQVEIKLLKLQQAAEPQLRELNQVQVLEVQCQNLLLVRLLGTRFLNLLQAHLQG